MQRTCTHELALSHAFSSQTIDAAHSRQNNILIDADDDVEIGGAATLQFPAV